MSERNDGGPAFPREDYQTDCAGGQRGMTLRDYFAAKAMQGMLVNGFVPEMLQRADIGNGADVPHWDYARHAYRMADAMLKAREGKV